MFLKNPMKILAIVLGSIHMLAAMESTKTVTEKERLEARQAAAEKEESIRQRVIADQLTARRTRKLSPLLKIPYINLGKVLTRVGPILAEYYTQAAKEKNKDPKASAKKKKKSKVSADDIITALIDCVKFRKIPLSKFIECTENGDDSKGKPRIIKVEIFVTDVFNEVKLKQFLTNFIIELKDFWLACTEGAGAELAIDPFTDDLEINYLALLFEKVKTQWVSSKHRLLPHYNAFMQSIDVAKIAELEEDLGKIEVTAYLANLKALFEGYIGIAPMINSSIQEIRLSAFPFIGQHLERFLHGKALFELIRLLQSAENVSKLNKDDVIKKALDCIKFKAFLSSKKGPDGELNEQSENVRAVHEEGCRVLLKMLFEMHSSKEDSATFAANRLLLILGEHSLEEKRKQKEEEEASLKKEAKSSASQATLHNSNNEPSSDHTK